MKNQTGFTLIELMMALAIGGLLLMVAIPSYQTMVKNNCMTTDVNSLVSSLQQARSEAVKRHTNVTISAGNAADNTNEWGTGWTITIHEDRNNNGILDSGEDFNGNGTLEDPVVRTVSLTCTNTTIDETGNETTFVYGSNGAVNKTGTFDVCDDRTGETGKQLSLSITGRPNTNSSFTGCN